MSGPVGLIVGLILFAVGLGGLGFAGEQMMTHTDPNMAIKAVAGLATFILAVIGMLVIIR